MAFPDTTFDFTIFTAGIVLRHLHDCLYRFACFDSAIRARTYLGGEEDGQGWRRTPGSKRIYHEVVVKAVGE